MRSRKKHEAVADAWRIHEAQSDWITKVDSKAAFAFGLDSAAIATIAGFVSADKLVHPTTDPWWVTVTFFVGLFLLLLAAGLSAVVVAPRLRSRNAREEARDNFIYFGHARHWDPTRLESALRRKDLLSQLTMQIVNVAKIAWKKHRRVQWSIWLSVAGGACVLTAAILARAVQL